MAIRDLIVRLIAESRGFERGLDRADDALDEFQESGRDAGNEVGALGDKISQYLGPAALGAAAVAVGRTVWQLGELGARSKAVTSNLEAFAGGAEQAARFVETVKEASNNTVDSMTAAGTAAAFLRMGLADTTEEMSLYVEGAKRLGDQTLGANQRIEEMTQLLKNQNVNMLDNFGLSRQLVNARIEQLQATQGLSREEAFLIAVQEEMRRQLGVLGEGAGEGADAFDQLDAAISDLKTAAGELAAPAVAELAGELGLLTQQITDNLDDLLTLNDAAAVLYAIIATGQGDMRAAQQLLALLRGETDELATSTAGAASALDGWMVQLGMVDSVGGAAADAIDEVTDAVTAMGIAFGMVDEAVAYHSRLIEMIPEPYREAMGIIESEQERLRRNFIRDAVLKGRAEEEAAQTATEAWQSAAQAQQQAWEELRGIVRQALQPTEVSALDFVGEYVEKWDEWARRLDAIAARGFAELEAHADWAAILQPPPEVLAAGEEALKEWAANVADSIRNLERPDLLNIDAAVEAVRQEIARQEAIEMSIDLVAQAAIAAGVVTGPGAEQQVREALGLAEALPVDLELAAGSRTGLLQSLDATDLGATAGDQMIEGVNASLSRSTAIRMFTLHLAGQVRANSGGLRLVGASAWQPIEGGFRSAMQNVNFLVEIARLVSPYVAAELQNQETYGGDY